MKLITIELKKIFLRGRTYISFGVILLLVLVIIAGISLDGQRFIEFIIQNLQTAFFLEGNLLNGYLVSYLIINTLIIHIPFLIALVTGDLLAGEANMGTFRLLLTRPVSRSQWIFAKFMAGGIYTLLVVAFMAILSLGLGLIVLGPGDLIVMRGKIHILSMDDVVWRFAAAYGFGVLSMLVIASLSLFFSSLADNSIGPIIGTIAVVIVFNILTALSIGLFKVVKPFLFTTYINDWKLFFDSQLDYRRIIISASVLAFHVVLFYILTLWNFKRKDILS